MNRLSTDKRAEVIRALVEGNSIRATIRMTGVAKNTVTKLLVDVGQGIGTETNVMTGEPDPAHISTSYVERQNLTMRIGMRRFTRLTNAFSKKVENLAAVSLHFMYYNFARPHMALNGQTPAMKAGIADRQWTVTEIAALLDCKTQQRSN
ncbi:MAG: transposase [Chloroflexota bacterium]|nr:transposase [Chloroflexota bacterium]